MGELDRIVVVGASLAGLRSVATLRAEGFSGSITVIGDEPEMPYDRPPLSKEVMRGEHGPAEVRLAGADEHGAVWRLGSPAVTLDPVGKVVVTADGVETPYDGAVLATGSGTRSLPSFDPAAQNVHSVRKLDDALRLSATLSAETKLLIVGCGFVGIEVASSARSRGAQVTVVGLDPPVAPAGPLASAAAVRLLTEAGVRLHVGETVAEVEAAGSGYRVTLSGGAVVEADQVVVAVGSTPNVGWLAGAGLELGDGVECDETLRVAGVADVVAAGDIVRWPNPAFGGLVMRVEHWSNAVEQGVAAAKTLLAGAGATPFGSVPSFWSDHFGIRLQSVGLPRLATRFEVVAGDPDEGVFCAAAYAGETLVGGVAYGMPRPLVMIKVKLAKAGVALQPARS
ncbi:FAD-dependent oxidoreductase [Amycolatopsis rhabdoformis]|uniref:FAD-dependent oxidoreductase n=1 Tax=Amycolatopsis rhabdoformis TaxID=1448059 RepID=A0ABZ1IGF9_9PSEU|nr:FAD-dependent oxidoreductase [Amycolatopsis rhabdoformis]WSE33545.1 FAD-dependent oxidoreductase [Amycolatopsis rhabdoformis]